MNFLLSLLLSGCKPADLENPFGNGECQEDFFDVIEPNSKEIAAVFKGTDITSFDNDKFNFKGEFYIVPTACQMEKSHPDFDIYKDDKCENILGFSPNATLNGRDITQNGTTDDYGKLKLKPSYWCEDGAFVGQWPVGLKNYVFVLSADDTVEGGFSDNRNAELMGLSGKMYQGDLNIKLDGVHSVMDSEPLGETDLVRTK